VKNVVVNAAAAAAADIMMEMNLQCRTKTSVSEDLCDDQQHEQSEPHSRSCMGCHLGIKEELCECAS
jgi:hypothetical protein